jgi:hypothetical protein
MRGSGAARLQGLRFRIPPGSWMSLNCMCCVLSGRGLCVGLITEHRSPTKCGASECDQVTSQSRRGGLGTLGLWSRDKGSYRLLNKHASCLLNSERCYTDLVQNYLEVSGGFCTFRTSRLSFCLSVCLRQCIIS